MAGNALEHIKWLGHAGFSVTAGGKVVFIDPYGRIRLRRTVACRRGLQKVGNSD